MTRAYWLSTVTVGFGAVLIVRNGNLQYRYLEFTLAGIFLFACVCFWLMRNLIRYHNREIKGFFDLVDRSALPPAQRAALTSELPFKLKGRHLLGTATFYLIVLIAAIGGGSLCWLAFILCAPGH